MKKYNIAVILHKTDLTGGPGHSLISQIPHFDREKFNYRFLGSRPGELTEKIEQLGFPVDIIAYGEIDKFWPFPFLKSFILSRRWFKKHKIDLAHFQFDFYRDPYLMAAKSSGTNCLIHVRGPMPDIEISWLKLADGFIYNSNFTKQMANVSSTKYPQQYVVHNSLDLNSIPERNQEDLEVLKNEYHLSEDQKIIGTVSRVHPCKNLEAFIELAKHLKTQLNAKFLILGNVQDKDYYQKLTQMIDQYGLNQQIVFTDHRVDILQHYYLLDCLVHTAIDEPFGRIFLEAAACKIPIVAYNLGGAREILEHNINAYLVDNQAIDQLAIGIRKVLSDSEYNNQLVDDNYENLKNFNTQTQQKLTESAYIEVLES